MLARYIYSLIILIVVNFSNIAQTTAYNIEIAPKSIEVHVVNERSLLIVHHILPKETLYSIARFYGTSIPEIYNLNEQIIGRSIHPGEKLIIKVPKSSIQFITPKKMEQSYIKVKYQVQAKETLYGISKRKFNLDIGYISTLNNLDNISLQPGQYLTIGWLDSHGISPISQAMESANEIFNKMADSTYNRQLLLNQKWHVDVQNIAYWHKSQDNTSELYVLHKNARVNSWIEIKNPMFQTSVKAKVIGHLPKNTYPEDIDLIVSAKVANELGVIDARFYVEVSYLE